MRTSRAGLELIKSFEGFRDAAVRLADGRWTVGFGHTRTAREGVTITRKDAEELLRYDLKPVEETLLDCVFAPLNQNQFDALVSLVFNISPGLFKESNVLAFLNRGHEMDAADGFDAWRKARINGQLIVVDALVRRRAVERALFLEPVGGRATAPTPLVTPEFDAAARSENSSAMKAGAEPLNVRREEKTTSASSAPVTHSNIAEAVERMASQQPPSTLRSNYFGSVEPPQVVAAPEEPQSIVEHASTLAAARISKILARVESASDGDTLVREREPVRAADVRPEKMNGALVNEPISDELPDFDAPVVERAEKVGVIDDTETFDPGRPAEELFAEALKQEERVNGHVNGPQLFWARLLRLAPWIGAALLCALGLGVGIMKSVNVQPGADDGMAGAASMMVAVFGVLLAMSVYFIVTRFSDSDPT